MDKVDLAIRRYDFFAHSEMLRYLFLQRRMDPGLAYEAPKAGYIVMDEFNFPVAAGFLRKCEGNYAFIDGFITNPCHPPEIRNKALDLLTKRLVRRAKGRKILAFTTDNCILTRAKKHGFAHLQGHQFLVHKG